METQDKQREKLEISKDDAISSAWGVPPEGIEVSAKVFFGRRRWQLDYLLILKRESDGKFFADSYSVGATESQENDMWEDDEPNFTEVFPVEKTVTVYE